VIRRVAVFVAVVTIALLYAVGLPNVGGSLILSGVLLLVIAYVRSGALSPSWLQLQDSTSIIRSANFELAKALICAAAGTDFVVAMLIGIQHGVVPETLVQAALLVALVLISAIGTGIF
jgi:sulfite exporter TauE/SafE